MSEKQVSPTEEPQMGSSGNSEQGEIERLTVARCSKCGELFPESVVQRDLSTAHWPIIGECGGPIEPLEVVPLARLEAVEAERDDLRRKYGDAADRNELMQRWEQATKRAVSAEQQRDTALEQLRNATEQHKQLTTRFLEARSERDTLIERRSELEDTLRLINEATNNPRIRSIARAALKDIGAVEGSEDG